MIGALSVWHWLVILAVFALLFGRGLLSRLAGDIGSGISSFRRGLRDSSEALRDIKAEVREDTTRR